MDDNVHMQNSIQIIDKLQDLNKIFEKMLYPNARHGIGFPQFTHARKMNVEFSFRKFLKTNIPEEKY